MSSLTILDGTLPALKEIQAALQDELQKFGVSSEPSLHIPERADHGEYTTSDALQYAKAVRQLPMALAERLAQRVRSLGLADVQEVRVVSPGYVNISLTPTALRRVVARALKEGRRWGRNSTGKGQTVVIDYSSPNIAKPMGIGHLRSTIIGQALANLHEACGYRVVRVNHLGDWGTQFGKLIVMMKQEKFEHIKDTTILVDLYVRFHTLARDQTALEEEARVETKKLQEGDRTNRTLWRSITVVSVKEFERIYRRLGIHFDETRGESAYQPKLGGIVKRALSKGVARLSDGAVIIPFDDLEPPMVIQKSDGAYLYATTDLAAVAYRVKKYHPSKVLYVVGNEQTLHFEQLKRAAEKIGIGPPKPRGPLERTQARRHLIEHISFGLLLGHDGKKFATRKGGVVLFEDLFDEAVERVGTILEDRKRRADHRTAIAAQDAGGAAERIALGAIVYNDLSHDRRHDIRFDWDRMLSFEGNSAPYLMYSVVRIRGIERAVRRGRSRVSTTPTIREPYTEMQERELARKILHYSSIVLLAAKTREPHRLAEYCYELAATFHQFYEQCPVTRASESQRSIRLELVRATRLTLENGLALLGIRAPNAM